MHRNTAYTVKENKTLHMHKIKGRKTLDRLAGSVSLGLETLCWPLLHHRLLHADFIKKTSSLFTAREHLSSEYLYTCQLDSSM